MAKITLDNLASFPICPIPNAAKMISRLKEAEPRPGSTDGEAYALFGRVRGGGKFHVA